MHKNNCPNAWTVTGKRCIFASTKTENMKSLSERIVNASSSNELQKIVNEMPKQSNVHRTELAGILSDTFWYHDLNTLEKQKAFMLRRVKSGIYAQ